MFRRDVRPSARDPEVLIDSGLGDAGYVESFGLEWQSFDGFAGKEMMSQGHIFGRFMLPKDFFAGKEVVDIGCGNGRIGRFIAPLCAAYTGADLSEAVYAFPKYTQRPERFTLLRASATDLPFADACADVTLCWGVLHHVDEPDKAFAELVRITRPGGVVLIYVYPESANYRKNLNTYTRGLPMNRNREILDELSDQLDEWYEVDAFFAKLMADAIAMNFKQSKPWQKFQWFDGITPRFHWSLEKRVPELAKVAGLQLASYRPGCFVLRRPA